MGGKRLKTVIAVNIKSKFKKLSFCLSAAQRIRAAPKTRACTGKKGTKSKIKKRLIPEPILRYLSLKALLFVFSDSGSVL